jgi:hypothetical protein
VSDPLVEAWTEAGRDLGLEIVAPFEVSLASGTRIRVPVLLRHFGAREGMLLVAESKIIWEARDEIVESGYGFSVLGGSSFEQYARDTFIEVLRDWGWSGPESEQPGWL